MCSDNQNIHSEPNTWHAEFSMHSELSSDPIPLSIEV